MEVRLNSLIRAILTVVTLSFATCILAADSLLTEYEESNFLRTETYQQTVDFCKGLADASQQLEYKSFGTSPEGRDLPLLLVNGTKKDFPLILIIAGIHSGEIDGKDAGLTFLRDVLISGKHKGLLDSVRVAFVPIFNVDGHERFSAYSRSNQRGPKEMGWRTTAQNLNLNRDWLKADSPEMRAMLRLIAELRPDFLADIHVTDGADYQYTITYNLGIHGNESNPIRLYNRDVFLPAIEAKMKESGYDFVPQVFLKSGPDPTSGWVNPVYEPRFSNGYGTVINRPFILIETHSLKDYHTRVTATYEFIKHTIEVIKQQFDDLKRAEVEADRLSSNLAGKSYHLSWDNTPDSVIVDFKGVEYRRHYSDILADSIVEWVGKPKDYRVPYFAGSHPLDTIVVPYAYIIPPAWFALLKDALEAHDLQIKFLTKPIQLSIETYRFDNVTFAKRPYEGRFRPSFSRKKEVRTETYPAGSAVISLNQPRSQISIHLFEPDGSDSFIQWGFMNQIFEQKEYAEAYVMDTLAARMLKENPALKAEFQSKLKTDTIFAKTASERLQFFYQHSLYWDERKDLYPIGRVVDQKEYERLLHLVTNSK
jgi:hypothetical protein